MPFLHPFEYIWMCQPFFIYTMKNLPWKQLLNTNLVTRVPNFQLASVYWRTIMFTNTIKVVKFNVTDTNLSMLSKKVNGRDKAVAAEKGISQYSIGSDKANRIPKYNPAIDVFKQKNCILLAKTNLMVRICLISLNVWAKKLETICLRPA